MSNMVIFLNGVIEVGKNEVASYLSSHYGFSQYAFGDKIRKGLYALNPAVGMSMNYGGHRSLRSLVNEKGWDYCKRNIPEVRRLLQEYGTEAGRNVHGPDCWTKLIYQDIAYKHKVTGKMSAVISDFRFGSEFLYFQRKPGPDCEFKIIHITKPGMLNKETHVSESMDVASEFPNHLAELVNEGSIEDLRNKIDVILTPLVFNRI